MASPARPSSTAPTSWPDQAGNIGAGRRSPCDQSRLDELGQVRAPRSFGHARSPAQLGERSRIALPSSAFRIAARRAVSDQVGDGPDVGGLGTTDMFDVSRNHMRRASEYLGSSIITELPDSVTCLIQIRIDPSSANAFAEYARPMAHVIPRLRRGPRRLLSSTRGTTNVAWALITFASLAAYERIGSALRADNEGRRTLPSRNRDASSCERSAHSRAGRSTVAHSASHASR